MAADGDLSKSEAADEGAVAGMPGERSPIVDELRAGRTPPALLAVVVAWGTTLAPSGFARGAHFAVTLLSLLALFAGLGGPFLARRQPRAGRHLGITLFLMFSVMTWLGGSAAIHPLRLDPVRGAFGAIAWGVFALSWSDRWGPRPEAVPADPDAPLLLPRSELPAAAIAITAVGVAMAVGYVVLAFFVRDPDRALAAQAVALACAVGVVTAAGVVATARGKRRQASGRRLTPLVVRALLLLCLVAVAGAVKAAFHL